MSESKWYNPQKLLSHNAFINFVMSPRGNGKSYSAKKIIIKNYLKYGKQAVYIRRTKVEVDEVKDTYWNDIKEEFPNLEFDVKGYTGYINGDEVVHFIPLSTSTNKKSASYPLVNWIIFDEYIITKTTYNRYLKNEMILLLDCFETILRGRAGRVLLMANNVSYVNPFFSFFDIVPNDKNRFTKYKDGLICVEQFKSNVFIEEKKNTAFGRLISDTKYSAYAVDGEVLEDTQDFIKERGSYKYKYVCTFKYNDFRIGVWQNLTLDEYYCDEIIDENNINKFCMLMDELEEGYYFYKQYRNVSYRIRSVKEAGASGNIYFCSQEIKKTMQDRILPYL